MDDVTLEVLNARADSLIEDHENMMRELISLRRVHNLRQEDVAERMGVSQPLVSQIERYDANPTLDTVRRYAMAVGARLETRVLDDDVSYIRPKESAPPVQQTTTDAPRTVAWGSSHRKVSAA